MFDSITIKSKESNQLKIDIGFLAECLLFYKQVNLLADRNTLPELFGFCGINEVKELIKMGRLNLFLREDIIGVAEFPSEKGATFHIDKFTSKSITQDKLLYESIFPLTGSEGKTLEMVKEFLILSKPYRYPPEIVDEIKSDLSDNEYLARSLVSIIKYWNPEAVIDPNTIKISFINVGRSEHFSHFKLDVNLNLNNYKNLHPSSILLAIAEARGDIHISGHFNSEIADKALYSSIIQEKFNLIVKRHQKSQSDISSFQEIILQDYKPIGEVIRSKDRPFHDYIDMLRKADKFRDWLTSVRQDKNIIGEYYKAVTSDSWVEKLPSKAARFAIFTGAGLVLDSLLTGGLSTPIGIGLGATDTFILDRLLKGWKPNHFIDDSLTEYLKQEKS